MMKLLVNETANKQEDSQEIGGRVRIVEGMTD